MCSHFPNTFSRGTVQKFRGTLVCRGTPFENPWPTQSALQMLFESSILEIIKQAFSFYILLTVHLGTIRVNNQFDALF